MTPTAAIKPQKKRINFVVRELLAGPLIWVFGMIAILACLVTFDLFVHPDRSITFDGRVHITTIQMYHDLIIQGEFPIVWVDAWGNYGHPLGLISYQVTSYVGGLLQIFLGSAVLAYNTLFWLATFLGGVLMYLWLRGHAKGPAAILGTLLFILAPYRLQNIYVRGALPEYLGLTFVILALLGIQQVFKGRRWGLVLITLGVGLTALSNPMLLVTGTCLWAPYALLLCWQTRQSVSSLFKVGLAGILGLMLSGYYLLPLALEIKYFHYGIGAKLRPGEFLTLAQLLSPFAPYFGSSHPGPPGVSLRLGVIESLVLGVGVVTMILGKLRKQGLLVGMLIVTVGLILLTLPVSRDLYGLKFLDGLQYPWRFLSVVGISLPLAAALLFELFGNLLLFVVAISAILVSRIPQAYGKNYILTPVEEYQFSITNLHTKNLAPLWAGESADYPRHPEKLNIIEGKGEVTNLVLHNSKRTFEILAETPVRLVDYTFFFPGWKVCVDGVEVPIEFQDVNYRGLITFTVPPGRHAVEVKFAATKARGLGSAVSALGLAAGLVSLVWLKRSRLPRT